MVFMSEGKGFKKKAGTCEVCGRVLYAWESMRRGRCAFCEKKHRRES